MAQVRALGVQEFHNIKDSLVAPDILRYKCLVSKTVNGTFI